MSEPRRLITKVRFAKMTNHSQQHLQTLMKGDLGDAVVDGKIDRDHPVAKAMIDDVRPPPPPMILAVKSLGDFDDGSALPPTDFLAGTEIEGLGDYTLRELATKYGTAAQLVDWLNARKKIVDISEKEIKNAKLRGELIPRVFVEKFIVDQFERTNMNLLNDAPKTVASELLSLFKANKSLEDAELAVERVLSTHITAGKDQARRLIQGK